MEMVLKEDLVLKGYHEEANTKEQDKRNNPKEAIKTVIKRKYCEGALDSSLHMPRVCYYRRTPIRERGGIGRRSGLKIRRREA